MILGQLEELTALYGDVPTRLPFNTDTQPTYPNNSFCSPDLSLKADWMVMGELSSNHLPILASLEFSS